MPMAHFVSTRALGEKRQVGSMGTKNISLPRELEEYIDAKVASGEYAHASEVVRDALRCMMTEEAEKLEWLRNAIEEGIASADRGDLVSGDKALEQVKRQGRALLAALKGSR
jgi:antitoxin ParD1/3/4